MVLSLPSHVAKQANQIPDQKETLIQIIWQPDLFIPIEYGTRLVCRTDQKSPYLHTGN